MSMVDGKSDKWRMADVRFTGPSLPPPEAQITYNFDRIWPSICSCCVVFS